MIIDKFFLVNIQHGGIAGGGRGGGVHVYFSNDLMDRPAGKWIAFEEEVMESWGLEVGFYDWGGDQVFFNLLDRSELVNQTRTSFESDFFFLSFFLFLK